MIIFFIIIIIIIGYLILIYLNNVCKLNISYK